MKFLNLIGLILVSVGALLAMLSAPTPNYAKDGSISLTPLNPDGSAIPLEKRIRKFYLQKYAFPISFVMIAIGALFQFIAACSDL